MKARKLLLIAFALVLSAGVLAACWLKWRGFRATSTPSNFETAVARSVRNFAIPRAERRKINPYADDSLAVEQGREAFLSRCARTAMALTGEGELQSEQMSILAFPICAPNRRNASPTVRSPTSSQTEFNYRGCRH